MVCPGGFGIGYILSAQYAGGFYFFERDYPLPPEPVELLVYESTSDGEAVRVKVHTLVINGADADTGLMNVLALVGLENSGDRTFVPDVPQAGMMSFLRFSLPLSAGGVDVSEQPERRQHSPDRPRVRHDDAGPTGLLRDRVHLSGGL